MVARYRANHANINQLLHGRTGPVTLHLANKGREAEGHARRLVGVKSGKLKATIGSRIVRSSLGYNVEVFAGGTPETSKYVLSHHSGAKPHVIPAKNKKFLKFKGTYRNPAHAARQKGGFVYVKEVHHPGNRGSYFLLRGGQLAGLRVRRR